MSKDTAKNVKKVAESYEDVPYISKAFFTSHPERQRVILSLFGLQTPDVSHARILEIGCSFGGNIIPIALQNPKAEVVGIDLSKTQIQEGKKIIKALGLKNIKLQQKNILKLNDDKLGKFDYIICHGVFSWVSEEVQNAILDVVKRHLTENGSALISYNTYPGWKNNEILRDMMLFRNRYLAEKSREISAKESLQFGKDAIEALQKFGNVNNKLNQQITNILQKEDYYLLHEYLEHNNQPIYLIDFANKLKQNGLMHVVDTELSKSFPTIDKSLKESILTECAGDRILIEQYWDYLMDCQFRSSLIMHKDKVDSVTLSEEIKIKDLNNLHFRGAYRLNENNQYVSKGDKVVTDIPSDLLDYLSAQYPNTVTIEQLKNELNCYDNESNIYSDLMSMIYSDTIYVHLSPITYDKQEKLKVSEGYRKYITYFLENADAPITFASYQSRYNFAFDNAQLETMLLFDGTRTDDDILQELLKKVEQGLITATSDNGRSVEDILTSFIAGIRLLIEENLMYQQ